MGGEPVPCSGGFNCTHLSELSQKPASYVLYATYSERAYAEASELASGGASLQLLTSLYDVLPQSQRVFLEKWGHSERVRQMA